MTSQASKNHKEKASVKLTSALVEMAKDISIKSNHEKDRNPFSVPTDHNIFTLRDQEKQRKKKERELQMKQKVHEKSTYTSRVNARTKAMIRPAGDTDDDLSDEDSKKDDGTMVVKDDPQFVLATTKDRNVEKEHLDDYIAKKREMFLVQYSLGVKRDEMRKLEEIAQAEEKKLELAEQYLEEDASMFDEFLKENDKNAVEAIKKAEGETKTKLEKVAEIKKVNSQMMAIKSEISKNEDLLKEYMMYKRFLDKLTPSEVLQEKKRKQIEKKAAKESNRVVSATMKKKGAVVSDHDRMSNVKRKTSTMKSNPSASAHKSLTSQHEAENDRSSVVSQEVYHSDDDSDEEPVLYFTDPLQLLDIFSELEEQNLSLIQNSQDTEEALDEMKRNIVQTKEKMDRETEVLKQQIESLKEATRKEEQKASELEMKSRMFSYGEFKAEDQEKMLVQLNKKVEEVYQNCIGDNEANISTLQMLTNIENRLEELFEMIEMMPPEKVELAEKAKDRERRLRFREEKLLAQKKHQEERIKKAIERAQAEPKKRTGRRLVFRSCPPQTRKREDVALEKNNKEEEEMKYFFT